MKRVKVLVLLTLGCICPAQSSARAEADPDAVSKCRAITDSLERLDCYDKLGGGDQPRLVADTGGLSTKWKKSVKTSPMDDARVVTIGLLAENEVVGWPDEKQLPMLIIHAHCAQNTAEMYVVTGLRPHVANGKGLYTASVRFGTEEPLVIDDMITSVDGKALVFSPAGTPTYINLMQHTDKMLFQFTPVNSTPVTAEFDVRGLTAQLQEYRRLCTE